MTVIVGLIGVRVRIVESRFAKEQGWVGDKVDGLITCIGSFFGNF